MRFLRRKRRERAGEAFRLSAGAHVSSADGMCAMELVAWIAGERHTDAPESTCPVLAGVVRCMNDTLGDDERQRLLDYVLPLTRTGGDPAASERRVRALVAWLDDHPPSAVDDPRARRAIEGLVVVACVFDPRPDLEDRLADPERTGPAETGEEAVTSMFGLLDEMLTGRLSGR